MTDLDIQERAAIMEIDGGLPRDEAERLAAKIAEGRGDEPEQLDLGPGFEGYRQWKQNMGW